jgi:hypothetical protein
MLTLREIFPIRTVRSGASRQPDTYKESVMSQAQVEDDKGKSTEEHGGKVKVSIDGHPKHIAPGTYVVTKLKGALEVDPAKVLEQMINGQLTELDDNASVVVEGGELFFSAVRKGSSS